MTKYRRHIRFDKGEVDSNLLSPSQQYKYNYMCKKLLNVMLQDNGFVSRRPGSVYVSSFEDNIRLIPLCLNIQWLNSIHVVVPLVTERAVIFYSFSSQQILQMSLPTPFPNVNISQIDFIIVPNGAVMCHPLLPPQQLSYANDSLTLQPFQFTINDDNIPLVPFYYPFKKQAKHFKLNLLVNEYVLESLDDVTFSDDYVGVNIRFQGEYMTVLRVLSATQLVVKRASVHVANTSVVDTDYEQQAFYNANWPSCGCYHDNRLCFAATYTHPDWLWLSRPGESANFETNGYADNDAFNLPLVESSQAKIDFMVSSERLLVFAHDGVWTVGGEPYTPNSIWVKKLFNLGSIPDKHSKPLVINNKVYFLSQLGNSLHYIKFSHLDESMVSIKRLDGVRQTPLSLSKRLLYWTQQKLLLIIQQNGHELRVVKIPDDDSDEYVWSSWHNSGEITEIFSRQEELLMLSKRLNFTVLEKLQQDSFLDCSYVIEDVSQPLPALFHNNDQLTFCDSQGKYAKYKQLSHLFLENATPPIRIGWHYTHEIVPLPSAEVILQSGVGNYFSKLLKLDMSFRDTALVRIIVADKVQEYYIGELPTNIDKQGIVPSANGQLRVFSNALSYGFDTELWRISQWYPHAFVLTSVTEDMEITNK